MGFVLVSPPNKKKWMVNIFRVKENRRQSISESDSSSRFLPLLRDFLASVVPQQYRTGGGGGIGGEERHTHKSRGVEMLRKKKFYCVFFSLLILNFG
jgi:hypothetical protein